MTDYQQKLESRFRQYPLSVPPTPWKETWSDSIGGLLEIGFAADSELLLVVSHEGRGVFDCSTGKRVARDYEIDMEQWTDTIRLTAQGIGPLKRQTLSMAGIWGGGLPVCTADDWHLEIIAVHWSQDIVVLCPPRSNVYSDTTFGECVKVFEGDSVRACGFSYTGRSFVIAEGSGISLTLFTR